MKSVYDVASFAETMGISYNEFIDMMSSNRILPFYERKYLEVYIGVGRDYGWDKEVSEVFDLFVISNGAQNLTD